MLLFIFIRTNMGPTHFRNNKIYISWGTYFGAKTSESFTRKDGLKSRHTWFSTQKETHLYQCRRTCITFTFIIQAVFTT